MRCLETPPQRPRWHASGRNFPGSHTIRGNGYKLYQILLPHMQVMYRTRPGVAQTRLITFARVPHDRSSLSIRISTTLIDTILPLLLLKKLARPSRMVTRLGFFSSPLRLGAHRPRDIPRTRARLWTLYKGECEALGATPLVWVGHGTFHWPPRFSIAPSTFPLPEQRSHTGDNSISHTLYR